MDFNRIKENLPIKTVLDYYGLLGRLEQHDSRLTGPCPLHHGDNETAFNVNLENNLYYCFTQNHGGSVIDLIMEIEGISAGMAFTKAREILKGTNGEEKRGAATAPGNKPIEVSLKLDQDHPYLDRRRIEARTRRYFGIGYCSKGKMAGRICIPIHDEYGNLVAYAGRSTDNRKPRYLLPKGFAKSLVIYNYHRATTSKNKKVILVEGYFDVFRLFQAGYSAVALMGTSFSRKQVDLVLSMNQSLVVMLDGDKAGKKCSVKIVDDLKGKKPFRVVSLKDGLQPDMLNERELKEMLR